MAYTTINKGYLYMNTVLYIGNNTSQSVTGVGFQPDWVWLKERNGTEAHNLYDSNRGIFKRLSSNTTGAEYSSNTQLTSFDSDGFSVGSSDAINDSGNNMVGWNWKADGTASSNTDGSITSSVSANTDSGFSIVTWTGTGADATVGHGLGVVPKIIIVKNRNVVTNWIVGGSLIEDVGGSTNNYLLLNTNAGMDSATTLYASYNTDTIGVKADANINGSNNGMLAYCFAEIKGYSKFGSYVGNGSADGPFIYTGFKPAFVLIKKSNASGTDWQLTDNKRDLHNVCTHRLLPNDSIAEQTDSLDLDILSNGFKIRKSSTTSNASGATYIYLAFAENPLVGTNNVPATAR